MDLHDMYQGRGGFSYFMRNTLLGSGVILKENISEFFASARRSSCPRGELRCCGVEDTKRATEFRPRPRGGAVSLLRTGIRGEKGRRRDLLLLLLPSELSDARTDGRTDRGGRSVKRRGNSPCHSLRGWHCYHEQGGRGGSRGGGRLETRKM